jgi:hydroxymethylbilane synthase
MQPQPIRIATRTSALAMAQAREVSRALEASGESVEIVGISTRGDRERDRSILEIGGDGVFVKELENALLDRRADLAVHSMKDLPTEARADLSLCAVLERADSRDVLVSARGFGGLDALPARAVVGTSSLRRKALILHARPDVITRDLRGNVETRLRKIEHGECDAAVLAAAGLIRLGLDAVIERSALLPIESFVPAAGQGAVCAQCRAGDERAKKATAALNHAPTALAVAMEKAVLRRFGGGCLSPVGVHARLDGDGYRLDAAIVSADGSEIVRERAEGRFRIESEALASALEFADAMLAAGGKRIADANLFLTGAKQT